MIKELSSFISATLSGLAVAAGSYLYFAPAERPNVQVSVQRSFVSIPRQLVQDTICGNLKQKACSISNASKVVLPDTVVFSDFKMTNIGESSANNISLVTDKDTVVFRRKDDVLEKLKVTDGAVGIVLLPGETQSIFVGDYKSGQRFKEFTILVGDQKLAYEGNKLPTELNLFERFILDYAPLTYVMYVAGAFFLALLCLFLPIDAYRKRTLLLAASRETDEEIAKKMAMLRVLETFDPQRHTKLVRDAKYIYGRSGYSAPPTQTSAGP